MKTRFAKLVSILIAFSFVLGLVPASAFAASGLNGYVDTHTGKSKYVISSTDYAITKGVTETNVTLNSATGNEQTMGYMLTIDFAANPDLKLKATYGDYYKGTDPTKWSVDGWTLINTSKQAADYEKATGENVVFATNGDYFQYADRSALRTAGHERHFLEQAEGNERAVLRRSEGRQLRFPRCGHTAG